MYYNSHLDLHIENYSHLPSWMQQFSIINSK
nr:MAG TPA: hypothetical protein [Caudoviricetes sp.]